MRRIVLVASAWLLGVGVIAACSSSKPLPFAQVQIADPNTRSDAGGGGGADAAEPGSEGNTTCYDPEPSMPGQMCECVLNGGAFTVTLPCGYGLCVSTMPDEQICVANGKVVRVAGCPRPEAGAGAGTDADADASANFRLPPCDAGASADASGDADADSDADSDAATDASGD